MRFKKLVPRFDKTEIIILSSVPICATIALFIWNPEIVLLVIGFSLFFGIIFLASQ